jgi:hypothetical protein
VSDTAEHQAGILGDPAALKELSSQVTEPPPALVARVMTRLAEPRTPSVWQWLRQPFSIELRLSPLALIGLALALAVVFVLIGVTLK